MSDQTGRVELGEVEWEGPRSYVVVRREWCGVVVAQFSIHNADLDEAMRLAKWFVAFWNAQVSINWRAVMSESIASKKGGQQ